MADRATFDALFSADAPVAERFVAHDISPATRATRYSPYKKVLTQYGMLAAEPDGAYGSATSEALERFYNYLYENGNPYAEFFAMYDGVFCHAQDLLATEDFFVFRETLSSGSSGDEYCACSAALYTLYSSPRASSTARSAQRPSGHPRISGQQPP